MYISKEEFGLAVLIFNCLMMFFWMLRYYAEVRKHRRCHSLVDRTVGQSLGEVVQIANTMIPTWDTVITVRRLAAQDSATQMVRVFEETMKDATPEDFQ